MLAAYRAQDWDHAEQALAKIMPLAGAYGLKKLAAIYKERIAEFRKSPPPAGWDGVYQATSK